MAEIVPMSVSDCDAVLTLWKSTDGLAVLPGVDNPDQLARFLERNPRCSFIACADGQVVGSALGGHDARRGFLYHVAVAAPYRGRGLGRKLAESSLTALRAAGIQRVNLFVLRGNDPARSFWRHLGFFERTELVAMSINLNS